MTAQQLKNSILQLAVQGKLVPQNPDDVPASVLLEQIKAEKQSLIRQGKIKKDKKKADVIKPEEIPFEIPDSWEWVRFSSIIKLQSGQDLTPEKYNSNNKGLPYITGASNIENKTVIINRWTEYGRAFAYKGDILLTCKGTVGTMAILEQEQVHIARQIMAIRPYKEIHTSYIKLVLETLVARLKAVAKSMIPGIARDDVLQSLIPLPPLAEQKRIVEKIEELLPYIDAYHNAESQLTALNKSFPEMLKKSILQEAVQGRLVPQNPDDEPASVLLERIKAEKQSLIRAGKIKKDKYKPDVIKPDEIPFEIPESWEWVRLGDLFHLIMGQSPKGDKVSETGNGIEFHQGKVFFSDKFIKKSNQITNEPTKIAPKNSVLLCVRAPVGKVNITQREICIGRGLCAVVPLGDMTANFVYYLLKTYENIFIKQATGTTFISITGDIIKNQLIPLPPLAEQKRIVEKTEELIKFCDML